MIFLKLMLCCNILIALSNGSPISFREMRKLKQLVDEQGEQSLNLPSNASSIREDITDNFSCDNRGYGYYADVENDCQIFHVCLPVTYADGKEKTFRWSFICPESTIFSQDSFTCVRSEDMMYDCSESERYYELNRNFGMSGEMMKKVPVEDVLVDIENIEKEFNIKTIKEEESVPVAAEVINIVPNPNLDLETVKFLLNEDDLNKEDSHDEILSVMETEYEVPARVAEEQIVVLPKEQVSADPLVEIIEPIVVEQVEIIADNNKQFVEKTLAEVPAVALDQADLFESAEQSTELKKDEIAETNIEKDSVVKESLPVVADAVELINPLESAEIIPNEDAPIDVQLDSVIEPVAEKKDEIVESLESHDDEENVELLQTSDENIELLQTSDEKTDEKADEPANDAIVAGEESDVVINSASVELVKQDPILETLSSEKVKNEIVSNNLSETDEEDESAIKHLENDDTKSDIENEVVVGEEPKVQSDSEYHEASDEKSEEEPLPIVKYEPASLTEENNEPASFAIETDEEEEISALKDEEEKKPVIPAKDEEEVVVVAKNEKEDKDEKDESVPNYELKDEESTPTEQKDESSLPTEDEETVQVIESDESEKDEIKLEEISVSSVAQDDEAVPVDSQDEKVPVVAQDVEVPGVALDEEVPAIAQDVEVPAVAQDDEVSAIAQDVEVPAVAQDDEEPAVAQDEEERPVAQSEAVQAVAQDEEFVAVAQEEKELPVEEQNDEELPTVAQIEEELPAVIQDEENKILAVQKDEEDVPTIEKDEEEISEINEDEAKKTPKKENEKAVPVKDEEETVSKVSDEENSPTQESDEEASPVEQKYEEEASLITHKDDEDNTPAIQKDDETSDNEEKPEEITSFEQNDKVEGPETPKEEQIENIASTMEKDETEQETSFEDKEKEHVHQNEEAVDSAKNDEVPANENEEKQAVAEFMIEKTIEANVKYEPMEIEVPEYDIKSVLLEETNKEKESELLKSLPLPTKEDEEIKTIENDGNGSNDILEVEVQADVEAVPIDNTIKSQIETDTHSIISQNLPNNIAAPILIGIVNEQPEIYSGESDPQFIQTFQVDTNNKHIEEVALQHDETEEEEKGSFAPVADENQNINNENSESIESLETAPVRVIASDDSEAIVVPSVTIVDVPKEEEDVVVSADSIKSDDEGDDTKTNENLNAVSEEEKLNDDIIPVETAANDIDVNIPVSAQTNSEYSIDEEPTREIPLRFNLMSKLQEQIKPENMEDEEESVNDSTDDNEDSNKPSESLFKTILNSIFDAKESTNDNDDDEVLTVIKDDLVKEDETANEADSIRAEMARYLERRKEDRKRRFLFKYDVNHHYRH